MNCNERADNMNKRKLTDYFKPGNNKNVRKDVDSTVQNEPIIETTTSQDKEAITIEEDKPFHHFTLVLTDVLEPLIAFSERLEALDRMLKLIFFHF